MLKIMTRALLTTGAAAVAVALSAASALASTWTVSGSGPNGAVGWDAGTTTLDGITCTSSHMDTIIQNGDSGGTPIGVVTTLTFSGCNSGGFFSVVVTTSGFPWSLNAVSQSGGPGTDVTMTITGTIQAHVSAPGCEADIGGSTIRGVFSNFNKDLNIPGTDQDLRVTNVDPNNNCLGRIVAGESVSFSADYFADQPIEIDQTG